MVSGDAEEQLCTHQTPASRALRMANAGEGGLVVQAGAAPGAQGVGWGCPEPAQEEVVCLPAGREGLSGPVGEDDLGGQRR